MFFVPYRLSRKNKYFIEPKKRWGFVTRWRNFCKNKSLSRPVWYRKGVSLAFLESVMIRKFIAVLHLSQILSSICYIRIFLIRKKIKIFKCHLRLDFTDHRRILWSSPQFIQIVWSHFLIIKINPNLCEEQNAAFYQKYPNQHKYWFLKFFSIIIFTKNSTSSDKFYLFYHVLFL